MSEKTIDELKEILDKYEKRKKLNYTSHSKEKQNSTSFNLHTPKNKLHFTISSPFYKRSTIHVPHHNHIKRIKCQRPTNENYLRKGDGQSIYEKRKLLAQNRKQSNIKLPSRVISNEDFQWKRHEKKSKKCLKICSLFKVKCENCKPKLDCFYKDFERFLKTKHLHILTGLSEIQNRLNLTNEKEDPNIRKRIVQKIEVEVQKNSNNVEKIIKKQVEKIIGNKNRAALYSQWGYQVAKVMKKYFKYQQIEESKIKAKKKVFYPTQNKLTERSIQHIQNEKSDINKSEISSVRSSSSKKQNSEKETKDKVKLRKYKTQDYRDFENLDLRKWKKKSGNDELNLLNQKEEKFQRLEKKQRKKTQISPKSLLKDVDEEDGNFMDKSVQISKKDIKKDSYRKVQKKIKRGSLMKRGHGLNVQFEDLLENQNDNLLKNDQIEAEHFKYRIRQALKKRKVQIKRGKHKGKQFEYIPQNDFGKKQLEELKILIEKNGVFLRKMQSFLIKNQMEKQILFPEDSELIFRKKASNLKSFGQKNKKSMMNIDKYIKLSKKWRTLANEANDQNVEEQIVNEQEMKVFGEDDYTTVLKFYDLARDNYYEKQMYAQRENKRSKCPKLDYFTSEKEKKSPDQYFQSYLFSTYLKEKQNDEVLFQKDLEFHSEVECISANQSPPNNIDLKEKQKEKEEEKKQNVPKTQNVRKKIFNLREKLGLL